MSPIKNSAFRWALGLFAAFALGGLYFAGVLQNLDGVGVTILAVAFGLVALALYKAIDDDDHFE